MDVLTRNGLSGLVDEELDNSSSVCDNYGVAFILWSHIEMH